LAKVIADQAASGCRRIEPHRSLLARKRGSRRGGRWPGPERRSHRRRESGSTRAGPGPTGTPRPRGHAGPTTSRPGRAHHRHGKWQNRRGAHPEPLRQGAQAPLVTPVELGL